jgi:hypothetical protein
MKDWRQKLNLAIIGLSVLVLIQLVVLIYQVAKEERIDKRLKRLEERKSDG